MRLISADFSNICWIRVTVMKKVSVRIPRVVGLGYYDVRVI